MAWWHWIVIGITCLLGEVSIPGSFVFVFLAIGSIAAGLLQRFGLTPEFWQQSATTVCVAWAALVLFRQRLMRLLVPRGSYVPVDEVVGQRVLLSHPVAAGASARIEFRGTFWDAHNTGAIDLRAGMQCVVVDMDGIALCIAAPPRGE